MSSPNDHSFGFQSRRQELPKQQNLSPKTAKGKNGTRTYSKLMGVSNSACRNPQIWVIDAAGCCVCLIFFTRKSFAACFSTSSSYKKQGAMIKEQPRHFFVEQNEEHMQNGKYSTKVKHFTH